MSVVDVLVLVGLLLAVLVLGVLISAVLICLPIVRALTEALMGQVEDQ